MKPPRISSAQAKIMLFAVAVIWGMGFIMAQFALDSNLSSTAITFGRFFVATVLIFAIYSKEILKNLNPRNIKNGIIIGLLLFSGFYAQTWGLLFSSPSNNALITAANVVIVPFLWWAVSRQRPMKIVFLASFSCLVGIGILSSDFTHGFSFGYGDLLTLLSAFLFAAQITATGVLAVKMDYRVLIFLQFLVSSICGLVIFILTENDFTVFINTNGIIALLYLGVLSTCLCYFLQTKAQTKVSSSTAAIIMCTESLFGAMFSVLLGYDALTARLIIGGLVIFCSVILPDLWLKRQIKGY
ncbi:MAG: DMT family transporter [Oscillospiraceae bacterium]|nr:DMT family transporter [Oscillospiraceae bacterium]